MSSNSLATELLKEIETSIHVMISLGRTSLVEVIRWGVCGGGVSGITLMLIVLTILITGDPNPPSPTPTPLPF
jgi:hypothetical protein